MFSRIFKRIRYGVEVPAPLPKLQHVSTPRIDTYRDTPPAVRQAAAAQPFDGVLQQPWRGQLTRSDLVDLSALLHMRDTDVDLISVLQQAVVPTLAAVEEYVASQLLGCRTPPACIDAFANDAVVIYELCNNALSAVSRLRVAVSGGQRAVERAGEGAGERELILQVRRIQLPALPNDLLLRFQTGLRRLEGYLSKLSISSQEALAAQLAACVVDHRDVRYKAQLSAYHEALSSQSLPRILATAAELNDLCCALKDVEKQLGDLAEMIACHISNAREQGAQVQLP